MSDPARLLKSKLDPIARRAIDAAQSYEPPSGAKTQIWRSIAVALPASGVLLGATSTASAATVGGKLVAGATVTGSATTVLGGAAATASGAGGSAIGSITTTVGFGLLAGKAVAVGLAIGLVVNVAMVVVPRVVSTDEPAPATSNTVTQSANAVNRRTLPSNTVEKVTTVQAETHEAPANAILPATSLNVEGPAAPTNAARRRPQSVEPPRRDAPGPVASSPRNFADNAQPAHDELREESQLLVRARQALNAANEALALQLLDEHRQRFARGTLGQERDSLEVQALMKLGRTEEAKGRARAFLARFPLSPHNEKMRLIAEMPPLSP